MPIAIILPLCPLFPIYALIIIHPRVARTFKYCRRATWELKRLLPSWSRLEFACSDMFLNVFWYLYDAGWWFGTCFIVPYIGNNSPDWFQRGWKPPTRCFLDTRMMCLICVWYVFDMCWYAWTPMVHIYNWNRSYLATFGHRFGINGCQSIPFAACGSRDLLAHFWVFESENMI